MSNQPYSFFKRIFDIFFSITFAFLLIPIYLLIALKIKNDSEGPILYKPLRTGFNGKTFKIYKFRTMFVGSDLGPGTTSKADKRITNFGYFLRKFKLDETPQFFNIIKGDMSFVGPRPELPRYTEKYSQEEKKILNVKPGITDFSSIEYSNFNKFVEDTNPDEYFEKNILTKKNQLRLKYVKEQCFMVDLLILIRTFYIILRNQLD